MPGGNKFTAEQIIGKLREAEVALAQGKTVPVRDTLGRDVVTQRRARRVLGQTRNMRPRKAYVPEDEPQLVKRIAWLATASCRYGF